MDFGFIIEIYKNLNFPHFGKWGIIKWNCLLFLYLLLKSIISWWDVTRWAFSLELLLVSLLLMLWFVGGTYLVGNLSHC